MAWKLFLVLDAIVLASVAVAAATFHGGTTRTVRTGVVLVDASLGHGTRTEGTGIVLTRHGEVLTNNHVIEGATSVKVHVPQTGKTYRAHILGYDVATDAALLQLDGAPSQRVAPSAPDGPRVGEAVIAVGGASGSIAFASGHVTGLRQTVSADDELGGSERLRGLIRFDAPIDPGDSGGPLLDLRGDVLGVDTAGRSRPGFLSVLRHVHESYAIPIGKALAVVHAIEDGRQSATLHVGPTAFLGIELNPPATNAGARVALVVRGSPAARAGIEAGARITRAGGSPVTAPAQIVRLLLGKHPGDAVSIGWTDRSGAAHEATARLTAGPAL